MAAATKKPKKVLTKEQKTAIRQEKARDRAFTRAHRSIFERAGFSRLQPADGIHFTYEGIKSELDDIFVLENVVVLAEYTRSSSGNLGSHAKGKAGIHNKIAENPAKFIEFFSHISAGVKSWLDASAYTKKQLVFSIVYGSVDAPEDHHKALFNSSIFMSNAERGYFRSLTNSLKRSARFELFEYLGIDPQRIGVNGVVPTGTPFDPYDALLLPEEQSHFPSGFSVVSFYVDPDALLKRAYVLRRNGWRDGLGLYQRLIIPGKISSIRSHLKEKKRVFANNIVITLPSNSKLSCEYGGPVVHSNISKPTPVSLEIPRKSNSVGIIDGQHRIFSYYEDLEPDADIDKFRVQQNLLATGLIYPSSMSASDREKFEASLFLEINSNQASAGSDIIQAIWVVLDPFKPVSVARMVLNKLADTTPLKGSLARTSIDSGKIRTSSIVSFGLQPLTKRSGEDSLFHIWNNAQAKARLKAGDRDESDLNSYIEFCVKTISDFLNAVRVAIGDQKWKIAQTDGNGVLSVTTINGLVILLRKLIASGKISEGKNFPDLSKLSAFKFNSYKSSQYADMASHMEKLIP